MEGSSKAPAPLERSLDCLRLLDHPDCLDGSFIGASASGPNDRAALGPVGMAGLDQLVADRIARGGTSRRLVELEPDVGDVPVHGVD